MAGTVVNYPTSGGGLSLIDSNLISSSWGNNIPSIVIDGTTADAIAAGAAAVIGEFNSGAMTLVFQSQDNTVNNQGTGSLWISTGNNTITDAASYTGSIQIITGFTNATGNGTGSITIATGQNQAVSGTNGSSGAVNISTGNGFVSSAINLTVGTANGGADHRDGVRILAPFVQLPVGTANPTLAALVGTLPVGAAYFNTSTSKLMIYNGTAWVGVTLA